MITVKFEDALSQRKKLEDVQNKCNIAISNIYNYVKLLRNANLMFGTTSHSTS
jgi:hypothetical protein